MRTFFSILFIFIIAEIGFAQDISNSSKSNEIPSYFGWENTAKFLIAERLPFNSDKSFSVFVEKNKISSAENLKFGFTGKQINSTSQWNHFSVMDDIREIQLLRSINPNRNYPFYDNYGTMECQPYPILEVKVADYLEIRL